MTTNDRMTRRSRAGARFAPAFAAALLVAAAAQASAFELVSRRSDGTAPSFYSDGSSQPAITPNGRYVVFSASATNLVTPAAAGTQIYLRDRVAGTTELISVNTTGGAGNAFSSSPSISDDGCRVVFSSFSSDLVAGDTNGLQDAFVRDRCAPQPTTSFVSQSSGGAPANAASYDARISPDGARVAFTSYATNLATVTGAGNQCLYMRDLNAHTTFAVPTAAGGCIGARSPDLSNDGSRIAFWAYYVPGTSNVTNGVWQIYLYDLNAAQGSQPVVISTSAAGAPQTRNDPNNPGQPGEGASTVTEPAISSDGNYVAFRSRGRGLTADVVDGTSHVYLKELSTGTMLLVSKATSGALANGDSLGTGAGARPALSDYAGSVSYSTIATNLAPETAGTIPTVVTRDPRTGITAGYTNISIGGLPAVSAGGTFLVAYSGSALDPTSTSRGMFLFAGAGDEDDDGIPNPVELTEGRNPLVKDNDLFSPGGASARLFAMQQYRDFLGREGDPGGVQAWADIVTNGTYTRPQVIDAFVGSAEFGGFVAPVVRLYFATFLRVPDYNGLTGNAALVRNGTVTMQQLADYFTTSPEFAATYGSLSNSAFVSLLYNNVLGRAADAGGLAAWTSLLDGGMSRGQVLLGFSDSAEYQATMANKVLVTMMYTAMLRRTPETAGFNSWVAILVAGTWTREQVINGFFLSSEYRARFLP